MVGSKPSNLTPASGASSFDGWQHAGAHQAAAANSFRFFCLTALRSLRRETSCKPESLVL